MPLAISDENVDPNALFAPLPFPLAGLIIAQCRRSQ
jgi:hypothetical protein